MLRCLFRCCGSSSTQTRARRAARWGVLAERDDQAGAGAARRVEARLARRIAEIEAETEELLWMLMEAEESGTDDDDDDMERLIAALPSFTTASWPLAALAKNSADDCAVCLEPLFNAETDLLRLLPTCRHAFHAACIDAWFRTRRLSCPFCRSAVTFPLPPLPDVAAAAGDHDQEPLGTRAESSRRSFSVELGGVTDRRSFGGFDERRTYSLGGSFDVYRVDEEVGAIVSRIVRPADPGDEAVGSRGWLGEYLDRVAGAVSATPSPGSGVGVLILRRRHDDDSTR